jgi:hypothetical protein
MLAPACQNIYNAASSNATALVSYGINAAMLTTFQTAINDYSAAVPKPRTAKSNKSTYTKNINSLVLDLDTLLRDQLDKLVASYKVSKPDFYNTFRTARIIIDPSTTSTQLKGTVKDAFDQSPLKGVQIDIIGDTTLTVQSTRNGNFIKKPLQAGTYTVVASLEGFQTLTVNEVVVKLGQIKKLDLVLEEKAAV